LFFAYFLLITNDSNLYLTKFRSWESGDTSRRTPLTAIKDRASHQGHMAMKKALTSYFADKYESDDVSQLTLDTATMQQQYGFSASDMGAAYIQVIHAALMNVVPTVFWVLVHIYSRPKLLASLREEAISAVKERKLDGTRQVTIEIGQLEKLCPKLVSVFRETLRLASVATLYRRVLEDTFLSEGHEVNGRSYLLKKGVTIMISKTVSSRNPHLWGGKVAEDFDAKRFLNWSEKHDGPNDPAVLDGSEHISRLCRKAYFPFGGGKELCPGRNFAAAEVMGIMVVLLNGFDITSADGETLPLPRPDKPKLTTGTTKPDRNADLRARITKRSGWENVEWNTAVAACEVRS
jgi:cytochrome P450